jgi:hypothetical protein
MVLRGIQEDVLPISGRELLTLLFLQKSYQSISLFPSVTNCHILNSKSFNEAN